MAEITRAMMAQAGASEDDMDDIASLAGRADGCVLSITIREQADGTCRLSLRSTSEVNSSDICAVFGGGGHACLPRAAPFPALSKRRGSLS